MAMKTVAGANSSRPVRPVASPKLPGGGAEGHADRRQDLHRPDHLRRYRRGVQHAGPGRGGPDRADDLERAVQVLRRRQGDGQVAFALGGATPWNTQLIPYALTPTLVYGPDPDFPQEMAAGKATFADSDWMTPFDKYPEMHTAGCFQDSALGTTYEAT